MTFTTDAEIQRYAAGDSTRSLGALGYRAAVAPALTLLWDPDDPRRCVVASDASRTAGSAEVDAVRDALARHRPAEDHRAGRWRRLAAVLALDHRLYLPLNRSLLDAEIAIAQLDATRTLPAGGPIRAHLTSCALIRARRASPGVVRYLGRFVDDQRPPPALEAALSELADGYAALTAEVYEFDAELDAVAEAWRQLTKVDNSCPAAQPTARPTEDVGAQRQATAWLDPRQLPARVLRLGSTADTAEIDVDPMQLATGPALRVRVAAFADEPSSEEPADVGIRLIDRRSGTVYTYGLLGALTTDLATSPAKAGSRYFEGLVALPESVAERNVRVDLFNVDGTEPPVPADGEQLRRVRRAALFLRDWRAVIADVQLWGTDAAPADQVRTIARRLDIGDCAVDSPLWSGGPSPSHLQRLADLENDALAAILGGPASGDAAIGDAVAITSEDGAAALVAMVAGPGDLLAAELAAAHARYVPG
jgi:hypothetical protein